MTPEEMQAAEAVGTMFRPLPDGDLHFANGYWRGAGYVVCKADYVSSVYPRGAKVDLVDRTAADVGVLLCLKDSLVADEGGLSDVEYVAFIADVPADNLGKPPYRFSADYVAIEECRFPEYREEYGRSAPLWGGFVHASLMSVPIPTPHTIPPADLVLREKIKFPTAYHERCSIRSVTQNTGVERFLKSYHMLELVFDWDLVQQIRALGDDLSGIGKLLTQRDWKELPILHSVIDDRCTDFTAIGKRMAAVKAFKDEAKTLFYDFDKDTNPLKNWEDFENLFCKSNFDETVYNSTKFSKGTLTTFRACVGRLAGFWIYRFRCSIAHHRIGEYVLTEDDEQFVVEFGEPLLREIVCQAFAKTRSPAENLARWRASDTPRFWVEMHNGQWSHQLWLTLLETLERSDYWPMDPAEVGAVLEELKRSHRKR